MGEGARHRHPRGARARAGARRDDLRRDRRLRRDGRRVSPHGASARRRGRAARHEARAEGRRARARRTSSTSTRTARPRRPTTSNETTAIKAVFGEHAKTVNVSSTKSATGHMLGAAGAVEVRHQRAGRRRRHHPADDQLPDIPIRSCDLNYTPNKSRRARRSTPCSATASASAGTTSRSPSSATRADDDADRGVVARPRQNHRSRAQSRRREGRRGRAAVARGRRSAVHIARSARRRDARRLREPPRSTATS